MTKNFPKEWGSFLVQIYLLCLAIRISNIWKSKMQLAFPAYFNQCERRELSPVKTNI